MRKIVKFYYDYFSPYSYLALTQLPRLLDRCGAGVEYAPIHVLSLMGIVGNRPTTIECKAKGVYARADLQRWARTYGVPFAANPSMRGIDGRRLLDGAAAAAALGEIEAYNRAVFGAMWAKPAPMTDEVQFSQILKNGGVSQVEAILAGLAAGRATIDANIEDAAKVGVFGAPSFVVDGELYFGNDRLIFLEQALTA
jgi:2-hydroxychromene-2-carboxylate isomerase